jgi:putative FmdB family regulatory protein
MPTYTYRCDTCNHQFEIVQRFSDDPLRECPECGAPVRRVIQPVGVVFKGSGWYITDSRSKQRDEAKPEKAKTDDGKPAADKAADDKKPAAAAASSTATTSTGSSEPAAPVSKPAAD